MVRNRLASSAGSQQGVLAALWLNEKTRLLYYRPFFLSSPAIRHQSLPANDQEKQLEQAASCQCPHLQCLALLDEPHGPGFLARLG